MKVSILTNGLTSGGSERVLSLLANYLAKKYDVELILLTEDDIFYKVDSTVNLVLAYRACGSTSMVKKFVWYRKYIKNSRPDIVIAFLNRVYSFAVLSTLGLGVPILASERNDPRYFSKLYKCLIRISLPFVKHLVVQTNYIRDYYPSFIKNKTTIIINPVNECVFNKVGGNYEQKKDYLINVGRLYPQKNQKMLIDSFVYIHKKYPHFKLYIYGEGYLKDQLASHINKLGLDKCVILAGTTQKIYDRIAESKALCMTSTYEGMSNVMMESICLGTPVITTKVSGTDELIENGKNGIIVSTNNPKDYADMVISYLNNPEPINSALANNDFNKYRQEYIFNQWENLINKIVNNGKVW